MADTYFGYVERAADSYVNWADVGRNMTATVDTIMETREEKKALIEKAYREDLDYIKSSPSGEHRSLNEWGLKTGLNAAEMYKLRYQMLKQGKIGLKDFTSFRQNTIDDMQKLYGTLTNMQEIFKEKMDRLKASDSQMLEYKQMELIEKYGDLSVTESYVNDLTGNISIGLTEEVEENGKKVRRLVKDPNSYLTVNELQIAANAKYDNYDPLNAISGWVEMHGDVIESIQKLGSKLNVGTITEITDVTGGKVKEKLIAMGAPPEEIAAAEEAIRLWNEAKSAFLQSELSNVYNATAILTDQKRLAPNGKNYDVTFDPNDPRLKDENVIYAERDKGSGKLTPKLTEPQMKDAEAYLDKLLYPMLDRKVKTTTYQEPRPEQPRYEKWQYEAGEKVKRIQALGEIINKAIAGSNFGEIKEGLEWIKAQDEINSSETYYNGDTGELVITPKDPEKDPIIVKIASIDPDTKEATPYTGEGSMDNVQFTRAVGGLIFGKDMDPYELTAKTERKDPNIQDRSLEDSITRIDEEINSQIDELLEKIKSNSIDWPSAMAKIEDLKKKRNKMIEAERKRFGQKTEFGEKTGGAKFKGK